MVGQFSMFGKSKVVQTLLRRTTHPRTSAEVSGGNIQRRADSTLTLVAVSATCVRPVLRFLRRRRRASRHEVCNL